jgi:hypothetical protein
MPLASPMAETFFELNQFYFWRAWGMTAKDSALPDSRSLACPMRCVAGNKTPRESGNQKFEKDGVAASGLRCDLGAFPLKTRHVKNTQQKPLASQRFVPNHIRFQPQMDADQRRWDEDLTEGHEGNEGRSFNHGSG